MILRLVQPLHELRLVQPCGMKMIYYLRSLPSRWWCEANITNQAFRSMRLVLLQVIPVSLAHLIIPVPGPVSVYIPGL
jgi:hypothetical protein